MPGTSRQPRSIQHIRSPKHQEQNDLVERHWGTIAKLANTLLLHVRLNRKFFYYAAK